MKFLIVFYWWVSAVLLMKMPSDKCYMTLQSIMVQVMAWFPQYLNLYRPRSLTLYGVTRPQRVNKRCKGHFFFLSNASQSSDIDFPIHHQMPFKWQFLWWFGLKWHPCRTPRCLEALPVSTSRPRENGWHFAYGIFKSISMNINDCVLIQMALKFIPKVPMKISHDWFR